MATPQEWNIGQLLSTSSSYWRSSTLHAAVKLGIFTALGDEQLTVAGLGEKLGASERGLAMLLNGLTAMGLVKHEGPVYKNADFSRVHLVKGEPTYIGYIIMHHFHLVDAWAKLDEAVINGKPVQKRSYGAEQERESFQMGMFNLAMAIAPAAAREHQRGRAATAFDGHVGRMLETVLRDQLQKIRRSGPQRIDRQCLLQAE